jgi:hypothetical protein
MLKSVSTRPARVLLQLGTPRPQRRCSIVHGHQRVKGILKEFISRAFSLFLFSLFRLDFKFFLLPDLVPIFTIINIPMLDYKTYVLRQITSFRVSFPLKVTALGGGRRSAAV